MIFNLIILFGFLSVISAQKFSLQDVIKIGLENNFDIRIAKENKKISDNNIGLGTASFLPKVDLTGSYGYTDTEQETNSPFSFGNTQTTSISGSIALNWTLFDGFKMFANNRYYQSLEKLSEETTKNVIENNVIGISRAFFNLVRAKQLYDSGDSTLAISKKRFEKIKSAKELGTVSTTDYLNSEVLVSNDISNLYRLELEVHNAKRQLLILIGKSPDEDIEINTEITLNSLMYSLSEMYELASKNNSKLNINKKTVEFQKENVILSRGNYFPTISLQSSYSYSDRSTATNNPNYSNDITSTSKDAFIGLNLTYNIFNGFKDNITYQNSKINLEIAKLEAQRIENELMGEVKEKFDTFNNQLKIIELESRNLKAAEQNIRLMEEKYDLGVVSSLEFRDAQLLLANARNSKIIAEYNAKITYLEINQLTGLLEIN